MTTPANTPTMPGTRFDHAIQAGNDPTFRWTVKDVLNGVESTRNITTDSFSYGLFAGHLVEGIHRNVKVPGPKGSVLFTLTESDSDEIEITDGANGLVEVKFSAAAAATDALSGYHYYECILTSAGGVRMRCRWGSIEIAPKGL